MVKMFDNEIRLLSLSSNGFKLAQANYSEAKTK